MKNMFFTSKFGVTILTFLLSAAMILGMAGCSKISVKIQAEDLMNGVNSETVTGKPVDEEFVKSTANFSIELFKKTITDQTNSLISPVSVLLALAMTANGADTQTLSEMEKLLGGNLTIDQLNEYLYTYVKNLPSEEKSKLTIANSIWFRDDENRLTVEKDFLQKNANYYNAAAYKSPFDDQTLADINKWVRDKTDGMIDSILDQIDEDAVMYLINAIVFDAQWKTVYNKNYVRSGNFTDIAKKVQTVEFMASEESIFLDDGKSTGFIKPYINEKYSFVAILPNEGTDIGDYIAGLDGAGFLSLLKNRQSAVVNATLPKFSYDYKIKMNDALKALGMPTAFDSGLADFSRLGKSSRGNLFIGEVLHKTFISVDELGTKAGAVTKVEISDESYTEPKIVNLNRPFLYAIVDNATNLPVFIGTIMSFEK